MLDARSSPSPPQTQSPGASQDNKDLQTLVDADQAARQQRHTQQEWKQIEADDRARRKQVAQMLAQGLVVTANDLSNAALIYQHGESPNDYQIANELSVLAGTKGQLASMCALSQDRFLVNIKRQQRFGTQFSYKTNGQVAIGNVDEGAISSVTDELRMDFLIPPLQLAREKGVDAVNIIWPEIEKRIDERASQEWQDQHDNSPQGQEIKSLAKKNPPDAKARRELLRLYQANAIVTRTEFKSAAKILASSKDAKSLLLANEFAMAAAIRSDPSALPIYERTWDAFLVAIKRPPRFGTVGRKPMDPSVTRPMREALAPAHV